jgi:hypothetical protein
VLRFSPRRRLAVLALLPLPAAASVTGARLLSSARDAGQELGTVSAVAFVPPEPSGAESPSDDDMQSAITDDDPEGSSSDRQDVSALASGSPHRARRSPRGGSVLVTREKVLALARASAVPAGHPVERSGGRPAGIELTGVTPLGIGMLDGDVITAVSGTSVRSEGKVMGIVVRALARHDARISATFFRAGNPWTLVVELPSVILPPDLQPR